MAKPGLESIAPPTDSSTCDGSTYSPSDDATPEENANFVDVEDSVTPQALHTVAKCSDDRSIDRFQISNAERQEILAELTQVQSLNHKQGERILQLEQALDQLMTSLTEMEVQVQEKQFLEEQLAATEETANIQQRAIATLKQQLTERAKRLEDSEAGDTDAPISSGTESDRAAEPSTKDKSKSSKNRKNLLQVLPGQKNAEAAKLEQDLAAARAKITQLEAQTSEQSMACALLQQSCQEFEVERDETVTRLETLEQQNAEMQEQILQQVKQASEYEAAVQYWRDRYTSSQRYASRLKTVLERVLPDRPANLADILTTLQLSPSDLSTTPAESDTSAPIDPRNLKVDLPGFLARHR